MGFLSSLLSGGREDSVFDSNEIVKAIRANDFNRFARVGVDNLSLLQFEDSLNRIDSDGHTFLSRLLMYGNDQTYEGEFAKYVMCFGARLDLTLPNGKKVWQVNTIKAMNNYLAIINYMVENLSGNDVLAQGPGQMPHTALLWMTKLGYYHGLKYFLATKGADPNMCYGNRITPVMIATEMSYPHFIDELARHGANLDQSDEDGWSALSFAAANIDHRPNNLAMVAEALIRNGANVNHRNNRGKTPLALAVHYGNDVVAAILRQAGALM